MTGNRCHRRKMMGRGAEGGCGTEEKHCTISRVSSKIPGNEPPEVVSGTDFYSQARKALTERCPFDADDAVVSTVSTLPLGLSNFLTKHSDSRKKHKKSHSEAGVKSHVDSAVQSHVSNIWTETEEYFRQVTLSDIENLFTVSSFGSSDTKSCFSIPSVQRAAEGLETNAGCTATSSGATAVEFGLKLDSVEKEEEKKDVGQDMEIDSEGAEVLSQKDEECLEAQSLPSSFGLEWLLGCKNKIFLTSERPSKKRKLLGGDAGLERLVVCQPSEGQASSVCHFCSLGEAVEQSNQILVCNSCKVAVHQKCYGVEDLQEQLWLCSWCKQSDGVVNGTAQKELDKDASEFRPCVLCPKHGGALKHVENNGSGSKKGTSVKFAHLFCCQWMPEVYVEDVKTMEPIKNIEGIKETRRKLVCYLCKVKYGACVRCSHGTCRTSFHPICARDAKHKMEIWGKAGSNNVELRAFCSKHSAFQAINHNHQSGNFATVAVGCNSSAIENAPAALAVNKPQKLKLGCKNGKKIAVGATDTDSDKMEHYRIMEQNMQDVKPNSSLESESGDIQHLISMETHERNNGDSIQDSPDFVKILKKLIDRGKAILRDVASDIGISQDSLAAMLAGDCPVLFTDLRCKIVKWLRKHAYLGTSQNNMKISSNHAISSGVASERPGAAEVGILGKPNVVSVKSVPPRRRTKSNKRILKENKVICSSNETIVEQNENGMMISDIDANPNVAGEVTKECSNDELIDFPNDGNCPLNDTHAKEKILLEPSVLQEFNSSIRQSPRSEGNRSNFPNCSSTDVVQAGETHVFVQNTLVNPNGECPAGSIGRPTPAMPDLTSGLLASCSYIHPFINKKLIQLQKGLKEKEISHVEASSSAIVCCNHQEQRLTCIDSNHTSDAVHLEHLDKAINMGVLDLSPEDEVEGELIYFQNKLLDNAIARKRYCDDLIFGVVKSLPQEIDAVSNQRWDAVLVNQYLCELREAKKRGRKEKRHKEAQAVLAAATAAAAASSRASSFRKDIHDEAAHNETMLKVNSATGRTGPCSQLMPRAKETLSRLGVARVSSEKNSDIFHLPTDSSKEQPRSCDICRRFETVLNPILLCLNCKVAVHLGCYRTVKDPTGPWYCELCEELYLSRSPRAPAVNSREKSCFVYCGLCGGTAGAFRKSTDGQWVHAFCAEWVLESTFKRGQLNPVEGMGIILKERDTCYICRHKVGVCIKCNYGHCQSTFHPSCARDAGLYMHVKTSGGKVQHKAYCERHSLDQREKAEAQQHGVEELKSLKQVRVELERLRLLCERIVKREKVKRELVLCSHDILASRRDAVAFSVLFCSPFFPPDVSSESATTSLKGHVDDYKSRGEAIQRSDDITVDSSISGKRCIMLPVPMDVDQKTDDSPTSQFPGSRKPADRLPFSGKQLPQRPASVALRNLTDDGERKSKSRKHTETFQKELIMTSDQASVQNQRLPKGFAYVPIGYLSKEKQVTQDAGSHESLEHDG